MKRKSYSLGPYTIYFKVFSVRGNISLQLIQGQGPKPGELSHRVLSSRWVGFPFNLMKKFWNRRTQTMLCH